MTEEERVKGLENSVKLLWNEVAEIISRLRKLEEK